MNEDRPSEQSKRSHNQDTIENARVGYQAAVNLWTCEGQLIWARFSAMLLANSIIVAVIGIVISADRALPVFSVGMPIAGLILCFVWTLMTKRGFDYYVYWIRSARELEEEFLKDSVKTVSRGGKLVDDEEQESERVIGGGSKPPRMSWLGSRLRIQSASYLVIVVFAAMYVIVLLWN